MVDFRIYRRGGTAPQCLDSSKDPRRWKQRLTAKGARGKNDAVRRSGRTIAGYARCEATRLCRVKQFIIKATTIHFNTTGPSNRDTV